MHNPIKSALLAYGMSGKVFHAPFLAAHKGFELTAVLERHHKNAQNDYPGIRSYDRIEDLLADASIELVVVNTPNNLHYEQAKAALEAGKHVLVEKPICTRAEELQTLFTVADKVGKQILFYQNRRWDSDYQNMLSAINEYDFGHIHEAHFRFDRYNLKLSPKTFKETPIDASGIQYDLIPHVLDQAIALFGIPEKFYKRLSKLRPESQVDDFCSIQLSYRDNLEVYVVASLVTAELPAAFRFYAQKGSYEKWRSDVQEDQLKAGIRPLDADFGNPPANMPGLITVEQDFTLTQLKVPELPSNYLGLFDAVYQTLSTGAPYPVTREQIMTQIKILSAPES
ncbi:Gfo/Idh/MocA family oxidoreductase [Arachidicoccus terrestris]|uniref:Gfo/Idh/MocA family oxidoreductase n=1 Tax=Arachidicoccus terrestris TaxID=2875539 RepID=UPI001CC660F0|nr:Gfo/Idh/MocA family oxidoreductase [Arachidicoccus terrestris]UAY56167.1 Gfo/Idh/MocA family oxidoreductase [Arachidicoccus terrestris]